MCNDIPFLKWITTLLNVHRLRGYLVNFLCVSNIINQLTPRRRSNEHEKSRALNDRLHKETRSCTDCYIIQFTSSANNFASCIFKASSLLCFSERRSRFLDYIKQKCPTSTHRRRWRRQRTSDTASLKWGVFYKRENAKTSRVGSASKLWKVSL